MLYAGIGIRMMASKVILLFSYVRQSVTFGAEGTGFEPPLSSCLLWPSFVVILRTLTLTLTLTLQEDINL